MKTCAFIPNFLKIYNILWQAVLPFLKKNKRFESSFKKRVQTDHLKKADIWIQAASAGEAFIALSLLSSLKPVQKTKILITATTSQGMEILKSGLASKKINGNLKCFLAFFPFDIPETIHGAVTRIDPGIMILLETEIWPALLHYLKKKHTRIFIVNARLSNKSAQHYKLTRFLWAGLFPDNILAISPLDAKKYGQIFEQSQITTMPNIKFDLMESGLEKNSRLAAIKKFIPGNLPLSILASIRRQEEAQTLKILEHLLTRYPDQLVAIFPRHMHRLDNWKKKLVQRNFPFQLRSQLTTHAATQGIILWDRFGELRSAYAVASTVFVGGSLHPLGGQNFIEPVALGAPTVTGSHLDDFAWVGEDIFHLGIVTRCRNGKEVAQTMIRHLETPVERSMLKQQAQDYIQKKQGGTTMVCQMILDAVKY